MLCSAAAPVPYNSFKQAAISRVVPEAAVQQPQGSQQVSSQHLTELVSKLSLTGFEPAWQRPRPAVLTPTTDELKWLQLDLPQHLVWDSSMGEDAGNVQVRASMRILACGVAMAAAESGCKIVWRTDCHAMHLQACSKGGSSAWLPSPSKSALLALTPTTAT